jgi:hypothetical protein
MGMPAYLHACMPPCLHELVLELREELGREDPPHSPPNHAIIHLFGSEIPSQKTKSARRAVDDPSRAYRRPEKAAAKPSRTGPGCPS